jgi:uncharacterized protein (TIGR00730 family)
MKICIYCSSSDVLNPKYYTTATELAEKLAQRKHTLVYGGAKVGIMGTLANVMIQQKAHVIGIIPKVIEQKEIAHKGINELIITETMQERKKMLQDISDAFITLPGGFGTLEELSETLTAKQLDFYDKPVVIFNQDGFYTPLIQMFENYFRCNFARADYSQLYLITDSIDEALNYIEKYKKSAVTSKWYKDNLIL